MSNNEREFIRRMPKAELHVHLEGSVYPETLITLAKKYGRTLPIENAREAARWFQFKDFPHFIEIYLEICNCLRDEDAYHFITVEMARRAQVQNIQYMEVTFAPASILAPRTPALPDTVIAGLRTGAAVAARDYGVDMNFILDPVRGRTPEEVYAIAEWWAGNAGERLIGFGLGGLELGNPASRFQDAFDLAIDAGARVSLHAGETDGPDSVRDALATGAERIGHGVRSIEDPQLVNDLAARRMLLEVSPTSNIRLGVFPDYRSHPIRQLFEKGVVLTVNSDDPPMFGTTLTQELEILVERFGFSLNELVQLMENAIQGAFLPDDQRRDLSRAFDSEISALASELSVDPDMSTRSGSDL